MNGELGICGGNAEGLWVPIEVQTTYNELYNIYKIYSKN